MNGTPEAPSFAMQLGGTALALVFVLALAWFALRGLKALQQRAAGGAAADAPQVLRSTAVGARERLLVVRYRDREYLLGVTAGAISALDSWPAGTEPPGAEPRL